MCVPTRVLMADVEDVWNLRVFQVTEAGLGVKLIFSFWGALLFKGYNLFCVILKLSELSKEIVKNCLIHPPFSTGHKILLILLENIKQYDMEPKIKHLPW